MKSYYVTTISEAALPMIQHHFYDANEAVSCFKKYKRNFVERYQKDFGPLNEGKWTVVNMQEDHEKYFKCKTTDGNIFNIVYIEEIQKEYL